MQKVNYDAKRRAFFKAQHDEKKKAEYAKKVAIAKAVRDYQDQLKVDWDQFTTDMSNAA